MMLSYTELFAQNLMPDRRSAYILAELDAKTNSYGNEVCRPSCSRTLRYYSTDMSDLEVVKNRLRAYAWSKVKVWHIVLMP